MPIIILIIIFFFQDMDFKDVENTPSDQKRHKIRITLTSKNIKSLESGKVYSINF